MRKIIVLLLSFIMSGVIEHALYAAALPLPQKEQARYAPRIAKAREKLQANNVRQMDQDILFNPLPSQFSQYQDQYYTRLIDQILAYDDTPMKKIFFGEGSTKGFIESALYNMYHPTGDIYAALAARFALFVDLLNIVKPFGIMPELNSADDITGIFFEYQEGTSFGDTLADLRQSLYPEKYRSKDLEKNLKSLTSSYKIHLNPADQFLDYIVCKLLYLKSQNKDFFDRHMLQIKIKLAFCDTRKEAFAPLIVIYSLQGKQAAQETLDFIYDNFKNDSKMGCSWRPAFNAKVTDLIYFAQGDRDVKKIVPEVFEGPDLVYYKTGLTRDAEGKPVDYTLKNPASPK